MNGLSPQELRERATEWLAEDPDATTREELQGLLDSNDEHELSERFSSRLEFGTAGLRGVLGAGPNRMNRSVVLRTTAGLCQWLLATLGAVQSARGIAIAYDGRRRSREFAEDAASVCAGFGLRAYLCAEPQPTPLLAYATRTLGCAAGIMVTASHNPPEYNGFKVYLGQGSQLVPPSDAEISAAIDAVGPLHSLARPILKEARARGLVLELPPEVLESYVTAVLALRRHPLMSNETPPRIAYTPMHGVGWRTAHEVLTRAGYTRLHCVPEQQEPDGEFPTVRFPNPEEPGAMDLVLALARKENATLVLANDPDADRLAVAIPDPEHGWRQLTGNEVGVLLAAYLLEHDPAPSPNRLVITTVVSSPMLCELARALGVHYEEVLTGFKWIAHRALELEAQKQWHFVFGYEEALGYTVGTVVRDKDGVSAALLMAEVASFVARHGRSLHEELQRLQRRYGYFVSTQHNVTRKGSEGAAQLRTLMEALRASPPKTLGDATLERVTDLDSGVRVDAATGERTTLTLPRSNVLVWSLSHGVRVTARPSGTEPKLKFYFDLREPVRADETLEVASARAQERLSALRTSVLALLEPLLGAHE